MSEPRLLAPPGPGRLASVRYALRTTNPPPGVDPADLDGVTRWVVVTRAAVLPMTLVAGLVAGLLAVRAPGFEGWMLALALVGITLAHTSNNLMNDLADTDAGLDTAAYPRALYAPHPILSGLVTRRQLLGAIAACILADFVIMVVLAIQRGWPVVAFAVGGLFLSYAYTAPPLRLKKHGLGEPDVFVTWGPLMVAGTYYSAVGELPWQVWVASVPVRPAVHHRADGQAHRQDPVRRTHRHPHASPSSWARRGRGSSPSGWSLGVLRDGRRGRRRAGAAVAVARRAGLPPGGAQGVRSLRRPRPDEPPKGFPVWPLWFAAICFVHTSRAGALLVLGLAVSAVFGIGLPL